MIKTKKQMFTVIGVFALIMLLGTVTYAFFNYTRTGSANIIKTGRIAFNSTQGTSMNLNNLFPIDPEETGIMNDATKVGTVTINVTGDTDYSGGIEYLVSAVNVQNTVGSGANAKSLPISIAVSVTSNTENDPATTLGTSDDSYFTNRETTNTSIYKVLAGDVIENNEQLLVGYIKSGATGVDGNIVIKAYIDENEVAITDTYPEGTIDTVITTGYSSSNCATVLTGVGVTGENAATYCATASDLQDAIDGEDLTSAQITALVTAGIVEEYTDGTTSEWVGDRTRFTTEEWNSLQATGVSFQVKVEANEGTWVEELIPTINSCPGCVFVYTYTPMYTIWNTENHDPTELTSSDYSDDYRIAINKNFDPDGKNKFLGVILDNNKISRAFACGLIGGTVPFCLEGTQDGSKDMNNIALMHSDNLYGNLCDNLSNNSGVQCNGTPNAISKPIGDVAVFKNGNQCDVSNTGILKCN